MQVLAAKGKGQPDKFSHKFAGVMISEIYMSRKRIENSMDYKGSARLQRRFDRRPSSIRIVGRHDNRHLVADLDTEVGHAG